MHNRTTGSWSINFWQRLFKGVKKIFSTDGAGTLERLMEKYEFWLVFYAIQNN